MVRTAPIKKKWYKSKTMIVNILTAVLAAGDTLAGSGILGPEAVAIMAAINVALRMVTEQPVTT